MQGDEAGDEGSGSGGRSYPDDDAGYDTEGSGDEGSGIPDISKFYDHVHHSKLVFANKYNIKVTLLANEYNLEVLSLYNVMVQIE